MKPEFHYDKERAHQLREQADAFASQPVLAETIYQACSDPKRRSAALENPEVLLSNAGLAIPAGLAFNLFVHPPRFMPFPDWTPFVIELTMCRSYWVLECDDTPAGTGQLRKCEMKQSELCLGFRVYPRPWPRGPFSL